MRTLMMRLRPHLIWWMLWLWIPIATAGAGSIDAQRLELTLPESARISAVIEGDEAQLEARLLVSRDPTPRIGVLFDLAPGWHLYWRNPGETGLAPRLAFEVTGHHVGDVSWPAPETFREADGLFTTYGYETRVLLFAPIEAIDSIHSASRRCASARSAKRCFSCGLKASLNDGIHSLRSRFRV